MSKLRFVGLDVHADTSAVAVAEEAGEVRSLGTIPNRPESIRKMIGKLGPVGKLRCCYEAGPTGYVLYWQLTQLGVACEVIAPSLVPTKSGDRVKTDRRDAEKLARCHRAGELTAVWVPDAAHEALRDLVRAREAAKKDQLRHRHRLGKFLLRHGKRPTGAGEPWTKKYLNWIRIHARFEEPALEATLAHYLGEVEHASERIAKLEQAIDEAIARAPAEVRGHRGAAGIAGRGPDYGGDGGLRIGQSVSFREPAPADGLQRTGAARVFQRQPNPARGYHQKRQCASASGSGGVGVGVPASAQCAGPGVEKTESAGAHGRGEGDCLESSATAVQEICRADNSRKDQWSGHDGACP